MEPEYEALWPLARRTAGDVGMTLRRAREGMRVGFLWDYVFRGDEMFEVLEKGLAERFPGSTFVPYGAFGNVHGHDEREVLERLPDRLREEQVDAGDDGVGA